MRDLTGTHVSELDEFGYPADVDGVYVHTFVRGSFQVRYHEEFDTISLAVTQWAGRGGEMSMRLTLPQAVLLRHLLDAGIADAEGAELDQSAPPPDAAGEVSA